LNALGSLYFSARSNINFTRDDPLIVASSYKSPTNNTIDRNDWIRFFVQFEGILFIGADFNAKNTEWSSRKNFQDGLAMAQSSSFLDIILNEGSTTYHGATLNKNSSNDLTLVNVQDRAGESARIHGEETI
jgi:hypothetical protein